MSARGHGGLSVGREWFMANLHLHSQPGGVQLSPWVAAELACGRRGRIAKGLRLGPCRTKAQHPDFRQHSYGAR